MSRAWKWRLVMLAIAAWIPLAIIDREGHWRDVEWIARVTTFVGLFHLLIGWAYGIEQRLRKLEGQSS